MKLAVDIGGTSIRLALVENDQIIKKEVIEADGNNMKKSLEQIKQIADSWGEKIDFIGLCCPGPLDLKNGKILVTYNLPDWDKKNIVQEFKQLFGINEVKFNNDANVAALGQYAVRRDENLHSLLYFTMSTGIGAGFIFEGKIFQGFTGAALEIANSLPDWYSENVHRSGIEFSASGINIYKKLQKLGVQVESTKEAFELYNSKSNEIVTKYFNEIESRLVSLISTAIYFLNPEMVVIGGSVAMNNQEFFKGIFEKVWVTTEDIVYKTKFEFAKDLDNATLLGCCEM